MHDVFRVELREFDDRLFKERVSDLGSWTCGLISRHWYDNQTIVSTFPKVMILGIISDTSQG